MASDGAPKWTFDLVAFEKMMDFLRNYKGEITEIQVSLDTKVRRLIRGIGNAYPLDSDIPESVKNVNTTFFFRDVDYDEFIYVVKIDFKVYFGIGNDFLTLRKCDFSTSIQPIMNAIQKVVPLSAEIVPDIGVQGHVQIDPDEDLDSGERNNMTFKVEYGKIIPGKGVSSFWFGPLSFDVNGTPE